MTTGELIKNKRKEFGFSAEYVAEKIGVSPATIYRYENGDIQKIPLEIAKKISLLLNIDIFSVVDFDTASELLFKSTSVKEAYLNSQLSGLDPEDVQIAYDYHSLGPDAKRIVKSIIESEKKAFEVSLAGIIEKQKDKSED